MKTIKFIMLSKLQIKVTSLHRRCEI